MLPNLKEVKAILEAGPLSDGLHTLEQFARFHKESGGGYREGQGQSEAEADAARNTQRDRQREANEELARWAYLELTGWESAGDEFPVYRRIPIQLVDRQGRAKLDAKGNAIMVEMPVLYGVKNLEQHLRKGMTIVYEGEALAQGTGMRIQAQQIGVMFQAIRHEAKRRLEKAYQSE